MDLFGVGIPELLIILVVALLVLGPGKTVDMARSAGRMLGEVRRAFTDLSAAVEDEARGPDRRGSRAEKTDSGQERPPEERD